MLLLVFANAAIGFGSLGISAVLVNLYLLKIGFDIAYVGTMNASTMLAFALVALPTGWFGTRFGLRGSLIAGYFMLALWMAIFLSIRLFPRPVWAAGLLVSYSMAYAAASLIVVNTFPYLMAVCPKEDRSKAFALHTAMMTLFAFLGASFGGFLPGFLMRQVGAGLDEAGAYNSVMWLNVAGYLCAALLLFKARPAPAMVQETRTAGASRMPAGLLIFMVILFSLQYSSENTLGMFMNVYFAKSLLVSTSLIGVIFGAARLLPFFLSPLQPVLINRLGAGRAMAAGYLLVAAGAVLMALIPTWEMTAAMFLLVYLVTNFIGTARNLFGQEAVEPRWRAAASAMVTIGMAVGGAVVGFGGSRLIAAIGFRGLFLSGAALAVLTILLYGEQVYLSRRSRPGTPVIQSPVRK